MEQLIQLVHQHPEIPFVTLWIFSALTTTMPVPLTTERWYGFLYNFLHAIAANLDKVGNKQTLAEKKAE